MRFACREKLIPRLIAAALAVASMAGMQPVEAALIDTFQADRDATLIGSSTSDVWNWNFGELDRINVGQFADDDDQRSILGFEVSSVPSGATINAITLNLHVVANELNEDMTIALHAITAANRDWTEGESNGPADPGESTWNQKAFGTPGTPWAGSAGLGTPGIDYDSTVLATADVGQSTSGMVPFSFLGTPAELTELIDSWREDELNPNFEENPGLLLRKTTPLNDGEGQFHDLARANRLTHCYAPS